MSTAVIGVNGERRQLDQLLLGSRQFALCMPALGGGGGQVHHLRELRQSFYVVIEQA